MKKNKVQYIKSEKTTRNIMRDVIIALIPIVLFHFVIFRIDALLVFTTSITSCLLFEYLSYKYWIKSENYRKDDLSAIITGLLLACSVPASLPLYMVIIGAFFSIVVIKMSFGGLGANIFNPALAGRALLLLAFPSYMNTWSNPSFNRLEDFEVESGSITLRVVQYSDVATSATLKEGEIFFSKFSEYFDLFFSNVYENLSELIIILLLISYVYLLFKKVITWHITFTYIATVFILLYVTSLFLGDYIGYYQIIHILSSGLLIGSIFFATDLVTSPMTNVGKIIFGTGCGVLTVLINFYSVYIEGVTFAILIMNVFVPVIDKYTKPREFGTKRKLWGII